MCFKCQLKGKTKIRTTRNLTENRNGSDGTYGSATWESNLGRLLLVQRTCNIVNRISVGSRHGRDRMVVGFTTTCAISAKIPIFFSCQNKYSLMFFRLFEGKQSTPSPNQSPTHPQERKKKSLKSRSFIEVLFNLPNE